MIMKKITVMTALILFAGFSFGQVSTLSSAEIRAEEDAINKLMDVFDAGFKNGDPTDFLSALAEDVLICGTDPSEFWNKEEYLAMQAPESNDNVPEFEYVGDRVVKVAPDGSSAIVVNQFEIAWSPNIPWRTDYHFIKTDAGWKVFFVNIAFVPKNEHIGAINKAIE
jgi:hypothetical protein